MPRVLIADDEDSMRALVARAIAMDGHDIVTAQDGAEALDILIREDGAFDLLLTDIQMPVMDGIALALTAARDFPDLTILLMTGFADQRERASGLRAIVHAVVTQPFSVAEAFTGTPGIFVQLEDTIKGFKGLVAGEYDHLPEAAFYMVGTIEDAVKKAQKLAAAA